jgi:hypothetical protein
LEGLGGESALSGAAMPKFLEDKLRKQYGNNPAAIYGTMNKIGAMHGNKETALGKRMELKHEGKLPKGGGKVLFT